MSWYFRNHDHLKSKLSTLVVAQPPSTITTSFKVQMRRLKAHWKVNKKMYLSFKSRGLTHCLQSFMTCQTCNSNLSVWTRTLITWEGRERVRDCNNDLEKGPRSRLPSSLFLGLRYFTSITMDEWKRSF